MKGTNVFQIAQAFQALGFFYGIPKIILTDNGPQSNAKFLLQVQNTI